MTGEHTTATLAAKRISWRSPAWWVIWLWSVNLTAISNASFGAWIPVLRTWIPVGLAGLLGNVVAVYAWRWAHR